MKVGVCVPVKQAKKAYKKEFFDKRKWGGLAIIKDALMRNGIQTGYCSSATVQDYDIVLVSITAFCDWMPFIQERVKWKSGHYVCICGGAGVLNIRPFLEYANAFVFGRAEGFITDLVREAGAGRKLKHESIAWRDDFSPDKKYKIAQSAAPYPHTVLLEDGTEYREGSIGCQNKCLYCNYTWHRKNVGGAFENQTLRGSNIWNTVDVEKTILGLDMEKPEEWVQDGLLYSVAIDGLSERLRRKVNKPISRELLRSFFRGLTKTGLAGKLKLYNIVGFPSETEDDWREFLEDLQAVDASMEKSEKLWGILLQNTPFRAMPATPIAHWAMQFTDYRGKVSRTLKQPHHRGNTFYYGNKFWCKDGFTEGLSTHAVSVIALRGTEQDSAAIRKIACSDKYWAAQSSRRLATLKEHFDLKKLYGEYPRGEVPTAYLLSWWNDTKEGKEVCYAG